MNFNFEAIEKNDPEVASALFKELSRQKNTIELIASENFVSEAVMQAAGSHLTNKYAEGYPGKRFYGGCEYVDIVESIAIDRAKKLFGAQHANVQPHSGAQANMAVFYAFLKPGDAILGMNLAHGGHLTHGSTASISGNYFKPFAYGVDKTTEMIDYDEVLRVAKECRPKIIIAGASAYSRTIDFKKFREIADEVGAYLMVDMAHIAGLVATLEHPSPVPYADFTTTTTHKTLRGPRGGMILCKAEHAKKIDSAIFPGIQGGPLMHIISAKAVCLGEALSDDFKLYQKQVVLNAKALCNKLSKNNLRIVSGTTDNHLMLVDLSAKNKTGKEIEALMDKANITCNKNTIPFETQSPFITSGIRLGTPAATTRGFDQNDMETIADLITTLIDDGEASINNVKAQVATLCAKRMLY